MSSPFQLIATAYAFYRKQPVLNAIVLWLLFVPQAIVDALSGVADIAIAQEFGRFGEEAFGGMTLAFLLPVVIVIIYFLLWGQACVLLVGKRMISSPAGRNRTSFAAVRVQARKFISPLLLTGIMRFIFTIGLAIGIVIPFALIDTLEYWIIIALATLALLPSIVYHIRTMFYDVVIVTSNVKYFKALQSSGKIIGGRFLRVLYTYLVFNIVLLLPITLVDGIVVKSFADSMPEAALALQIIVNLAYSYALMLFLLSSIAFYKEMKESAA